MSRRPGIAVEELVVRFGGLLAVDRVTLEAPLGRITAVIGPNGAGKSTTFNACTGLLRPTAGRVTLFGQDVTDAGPAERAQRGLGRTFQRMELYDSLSVRENVMMGREAAYAGRRVVNQLVASRAEREATAAAAETQLRRCGLEEVAERPAATLSTGQRRLVELARALASPCRMLLLDEPSSGLDAVETEAFAAILQNAMSERELGILIVEHDMALVSAICEHVYVLDFGCLIFEGTMQEVHASDLVRDAYLGTGAH